MGGTTSPNARHKVEVALLEIWFIMINETRESELIRLRREQKKTREDEVFLGSSAAERAEYQNKEDRIHELERDLPEQARLSLLNAA
jgi:hypothetical protein